MLVVAIKNTILVVLIILIIHFLLKTLNVGPSDNNANKDARAPLSQFPLPILSSETTESFMEISKQDPVDAPIPKQALLEDDPPTCNQALTTTEETKTLESNCVLDQPNPNAFLLLNTYQDENQMNNNKWLDNIDLYDEFSSHLSSYQ